MSNKIVTLLAVPALVLSLAACDTTAGNKQTGGTLIGAGLGGLLGAQFGKGTGQLAAVALGTVAGALLGNGIGQSLDRADRSYLERNTQYGLESTRAGTVTTWQNPDSGNYGTITPTATYRAPDGEYCREYQQSVTVGGRTETAYGTACRQPDGTWRIGDGV